MGKQQSQVSRPVADGDKPIMSTYDAPPKVHDSTAESLAETQDHHGIASPGSTSDDAVASRSATSDVAVNPSPHCATETRYQILRPHARGGLGEVFVARDVELNREVAIKEIQSKFADQLDRRSRFRLEAEITGGLEHPGIVPVYGLGQHSDGRPYYAMRFIRGSSLNAAIERFHQGQGERAVEFRKLLGRFVDVCNAIEYAHSRGVLHRDLKPDNIILGNYGETLVVDWGLAKALGKADHADASLGPLQPMSEGGSAETKFGSVLGTPGYMSPEQAAGRLDELGPATDVYSLGATLYHLLTGQRSVAGRNLHEMLHKAEVGDIPPPRSVRPDVPLPLDAICRMAMSIAPADRYRSPQELADEVERWLADEPVRAYRERPIERVTRWARKHKTLVTASAAVILVAATLLSVGVLLLTAANGRERLAKQQAESNFKDAELHRTQAQRNFSLARGAVDSYLTKVAGDSRLRARGLERLRTDLLNEARGFYEEFVRQQDQDAELRIDLARAHTRLGLITEEVGSIVESLDLYRKATDHFNELAIQFPDQPDLKRELATSQRDLGLGYHALSRDKEAEESLKLAATTAKELVSFHPDRHEFEFELASCFSSLGKLYTDTLRIDDAVSAYQAALEVTGRLAQQAPKSFEYQMARAKTYLSLGSAYHRGRRSSEAGAVYQAARDILASFGVPDDAVAREEYHRVLGLAHYNTGHFNLSQARPDDARTNFQQAREIWEELSLAHPDVVEYQVRLGAVLYRLGSLDLSAGHADRACAILDDCVAAWKRLVRLHGEVPDYRETMPLIWNLLADAARKSGDYEKAVLANSAALTLVEEETRPSNPIMAAVNRYDAYIGRAQSLVFLKRHGDAAADWSRAIELGLAGHGAGDEMELQAALVLALARSGDHRRAILEVEKLLQPANPKAEVTYTMAVVYALASSAAIVDNAVPPSERTRLATDYADRSLQMLQMSKKAGHFRDAIRAADLKKETAFDVLREREDFQSFMHEVELDQKD